jgi:hypothetical protein
MDLHMLADCPECGLPATVTAQGRAASTDGPVEVVKLRCVMLHWFLGPTDTLLPAPSPKIPTTSRKLPGRLGSDPATSEKLI